MGTAIVASAAARTVRKRPAKNAKKPERARKPLNLRIKPEVRSLIDHAAELTGKNLTDFVLDAARQAAQHALLDRAVIPVNGKAYRAFIRMLAAPPKPNANLRRALQRPAVWE